jgi:anaerobic selenocysteine-containing dehydrogenase
MDLNKLNKRVSAARAEVEARGETFYPGPSRIHLSAFPPKERWNDWVELDSSAWPERVERRYMLVPTTCFNCESACGLLAYVDRETLEVRKFEGNPEHPGSRGRNCAKGPATLNQVTDPDRILHPLKRTGERGEGKWERVSWDEALDGLAERIRAALTSGRANEVMYHVGRPGEAGFANKVLAAWGVDGHNSHTNICSSGARVGFNLWVGSDRPSPDFTNAEVIFLISSHLEAGHYFNPHAQRIIDARKRGAKVIVFDTRLSNTATHADHYVAPYPGSEAAINLAIANYLIQNDLYNREFVERWWNWREYLEAKHPTEPVTFERFEGALKELYTEYTFEYAEAESGVEADALRAVAETVATAGTRLSVHNWRSAASGNLGGWQVARTLYMLCALTGSVATEGGTHPAAWNKFTPKPIYDPPGPPEWNELLWPREYPLSHHEMSILLPHFLLEGRGKLDTYFTRVYNPVWTNPDGFAWIEALTDESLVGMHVALTPTWNETAQYADYVLPMGLASERHDVHSYEQYDGQWVGFRQPVLRAARERLGEDIEDTRESNPGEVWEENEFWMELSWRIDPDGSLGVRKYFESKKQPGTPLSVDEYYGWMFDNSVPGLPEAAAKEGLTPLKYMRRYGAFEVRTKVGALYEEEVPEQELDGIGTDAHGRVFTRAPKPISPHTVSAPKTAADAEARRCVGIMMDDSVRRGFPTPSGRLEFFSTTMEAWGWPEFALPGYIKSHIHRQNLASDQMVLLPTFRVPIQIHTRSGNAKWLDEIAHTNPLWIHPRDAAPHGVITGDLMRVETDLGHFVLKAWVTEAIKPGVVACSHHMGRWRLHAEGQRQVSAAVSLDRTGNEWAMRRIGGTGAYASEDEDTRRIWWADVGVNQNLTFPVHPDPISGMHCWHQAVRIKKAGPGEAAGDIQVDTTRSREVFREWLDLTRPVDGTSPDGTRRPAWFDRPVRPQEEAYRLPVSDEGGGA